MGAAYFIIPEECDRELCWPKLAYVQLGGARRRRRRPRIIGFHFNWWEGRKFLEIPRPLDYLVVIDVLLFIANIGMTVWNGRRITTTVMVLFFGLLAAALLYLPGMIATTNQTEDCVLALVGGASLGRGRLGADHGRRSSRSCSSSSPASTARSSRSGST